MTRITPSRDAVRATHADKNQNPHQETCALGVRTSPRLRPRNAQLVLTPFYTSNELRAPFNSMVSVPVRESVLGQLRLIGIGIPTGVRLRLGSRVRQIQHSEWYRPG